METFIKKVEELKELLKALIGMPKIPKPPMPKIPKPGDTNPATPVSTGVIPPPVDPRTPASKKDPKMAGTRTNQIAKPKLTFNKSEQWSLDEPESEPVKKTEELEKTKMYHGTSGDKFSRFDDNKINRVKRGFGHYMTEDPKVAHSYGSTVLSDDVNIKNPLQIDKPPTNAHLNALQQHVNYFKDVAPEHAQIIQGLINYHRKNPSAHLNNSINKDLSTSKAFSIAASALGHDALSGHGAYALLDPDMASNLKEEKQ